jgi:uncharacterized membrane protein
MSRRRHLALTGLVVVLAGSGVLHLVRARPYRRMVPRPLARWRSQVVAVSGSAEMTCALLLLMPKTRRVGAYASALLFVAVFPANVHTALDGGDADAEFPANTAAVGLAAPAAPGAADLVGAQLSSSSACLGRGP